MSDPIDRQVAIDALDVGAELLRRVLDDTDIVGAERAKYEWGLGLIESCISDMRELPSVQQWIPCSERLPENSGWHIVTKELDYDTTFVGLEWYDSTNGWKYDNSKCIAWIPFPESYKGEQG